MRVLSVGAARCPGQGAGLLHVRGMCYGSWMSDPTAFNLHDTSQHDARYSLDPQVRRVTGWTAHGNIKLDVPFITQVTENLWHGGVESGLVLPDFITAKLSLYQWESYAHSDDVVTQTVEMYDSMDQSMDQVEELAEWVNEQRAEGHTVLVHCQAGLNRSALVIAKALILSGEVENGKDAVKLLRALRSPAVLCNPVFERWVQSQ